MCACVIEKSEKKSLEKNCNKSNCASNILHQTNENFFQIIFFMFNCIQFKLGHFAVEKFGMNRSEMIQIIAKLFGSTIFNALNVFFPVQTVTKVHNKMLQNLN